MNKLIKIALITLALTTVSACSGTASLIGSPPVFVGAEVPDSVRRCLPEPDRLVGDFTQRDVAAYIVKLRHARNNCAANLAAVDNILIQQEQLALLAQATTE